MMSTKLDNIILGSNKIYENIIRFKREISVAISKGREIRTCPNIGNESYIHINEERKRVHFKKREGPHESKYLEKEGVRKSYA